MNEQLDSGEDRPRSDGRPDDGGAGGTGELRPQPAADPDWNAILPFIAFPYTESKPYRYKANVHSFDYTIPGTDYTIPVIIDTSVPNGQWYVASNPPPGRLSHPYFRWDGDGDPANRDQSGGQPGDGDAGEGRVAFSVAGNHLSGVSGDRDRDRGTGIRSGEEKWSSKGVAEMKWYQNKYVQAGLIALASGTVAAMAVYLATITDGLDTRHTIKVVGGAFLAPFLLLINVLPKITDILVPTVRIQSDQPLKTAMAAEPPMHEMLTNQPDTTVVIGVPPSYKP
jgi:hypothetical protein